VTGVIDANEIIQKFKTQGLTTDSLQELQNQYASKIEGLKFQKDELRRHLESRRFASESGGPERRRLDEIEQDLARTSNQFERMNLKHSKLASSMINITAGIQHLREMTAFYKREGE
jgi:K+/H+ antiporter YhaU regulatory subunit KhtT